MTTDITELAQEARINAGCGEYLSPAETMELVDALEKAQTERDEFRNRLKLERSILEGADKRIAELESRTVKLPPCVDDLHGIGMVMSADAVVEALTSYGIKVEAE
ncbi:TPA: hypothetical protein ACRRZ6_000923 [Klebsiella quasipneumoniae]